MSPFLFINDIPLALGGWAAFRNQRLVWAQSRNPRVPIGGYKLSRIKTTKCTSWFFLRACAKRQRKFLQYITLHYSGKLSPIKINHTFLNFSQHTETVANKASENSNPCADLWPHVRLSPWLDGEKWTCPPPADPIKTHLHNGSLSPPARPSYRYFTADLGAETD